MPRRLNSVRGGKCFSDTLNTAASCATRADCSTRARPPDSVRFNRARFVTCLDVRPFPCCRTARGSRRDHTDKQPPGNRVGIIGSFPCVFDATRSRLIFITLALVSCSAPNRRLPRILWLLAERSKNFFLTFFGAGVDDVISKTLPRDDKV